nr:MAG TPA: hypothetical protein [Caudoviricetes sp.]
MLLSAPFSPIVSFGLLGFCAVSAVLATAELERWRVIFFIIN